MGRQSASEPQWHARTGSRQNQIIAEAIAYWDRLRGQRAFPRRDEIDPNAISDLWRHCFLVALDDPAAEPAIVACGDAMADICRADPQERPPLGACLPKSLAETVSGFLVSVIEYQKPLGWSGAFRVYRGRRDIPYRCALMPMSGNGETIDGVFGVLSLSRRPSPPCTPDGAPPC